MLKDNMHLENFENQRVLKMHIIFILSTLILRKLGLQKYFTLTPKKFALTRLWTVYGLCCWWW